MSMAEISRLFLSVPAETPVAAVPPRLDDPSLFINRELSWLEFNARVLAEAADDRVPLYERLKFVAIFATNLDEFFMVRVAGLQAQLSGEIDEVPPDGKRSSARPACRCSRRTSST
jgi:polyphosphate kinase